MYMHISTYYTYGRVWYIVYIQDPHFRKRWKFLFLSVRPSTYWWITASLAKAPMVMKNRPYIGSGGLELVDFPQNRLRKPRV